MLLDKEYALDRSHSSQVVSSENHNRHILKNDVNAVIYQYRIDGNKANNSPKPVFLSGTSKKRCDFASEVVVSDKETRLHLIELKGSDLKEAIFQIESTIETFKNDNKIFGRFRLDMYEIYPRVVIHRVNTHALNDSVTRRIKSRFPRFVVKERILEESVSKPVK